MQELPFEAGLLDDIAYNNASRLFRIGTPT
jgi:hypothetical protein